MKRLIILAACAALAAPSCSDFSGGASSGRTQVLLTDAPFPYDSIAAVNVYVARIDASEQTDTTGGSAPSWTTVATPERAFNLLALQQGATALLGEADLPPSQYRAVRMVINTTRSSIVRNNGSEATVHWPEAGDLALHALVEDPLHVGQGGARIVIDFDVGRSFLRDVQGSFSFIPYIRAVNDAATGAIRGSVSLAPDANFTLLTMENTAIEVYRSNSYSPLRTLSATGRVDAQGEYVIPYLSPGLYTVEAYPPGYPWRRGSVAGTDVVAGQTATANIVIGPDSTGGPNCCDSLPPPPDSLPAPGGGSGPVHSISLTPAAQAVSVGDSVSVLAVPRDSLDRVLQGRAIAWSYSDSTVVSTIWQGSGWLLLRALKAGTVTLTAASEGKTGTASVTVQ